MCSLFGDLLLLGEKHAKPTLFNLEFLRSYSKAFGYKMSALLPDLPDGIRGLRPSEGAMDVTWALNRKLGNDLVFFYIATITQQLIYIITW